MLKLTMWFNWLTSGILTPKIIIKIIGRNWIMKKYSLVTLLSYWLNSKLSHRTDKTFTPMTHSVNLFILRCLTTILFLIKTYKFDHSHFETCMRRRLNKLYHVRLLHGLSPRSYQYEITFMIRVNKILSQ